MNSRSAENIGKGNNLFQIFNLSVGLEPRVR